MRLHRGILVIVIAILGAESEIACYIVSIPSAGCRVSPLEGYIVLRVEHTEGLGSPFCLIVTVVAYRDLAFSATLCRDEDNAVTTACTVDGCR